MSRQLISQRVQNIKPSGIRRFFDIAGELWEGRVIDWGRPLQLLLAAPGAVAHEGADRVQGLSAQELKGKTTLEVGAWLTPADRDAFVLKLQREGRIHNYDTRMRHKDGTYRWLELTRKNLLHEPSVRANQFEIVES